MNKKLVALLAVATMGISVVGATPQTQFTKGETQVDLGAARIARQNCYPIRLPWFELQTC